MTVHDGGPADWRDSGLYRRLARIDRAGLMWEWLRRDPGYIAWYARASAVTHGPPHAIPPDPLPWGCTFAEDPAIAAPGARLIWHAGLDPSTPVVEAMPAAARDPNAIDPAAFGQWLTVAADMHDREHAVLSDGWHHIRFDVVAGTLSAGPVILRYRLQGSVAMRPKLLPLRRLIDFSLHRRFARSLYPADPRIARWLAMLQVLDGLSAGASQREIAEALFGTGRVTAEWERERRSDSIRSRVRRLAAGALKLARGGYRDLMSRRG